MPEIMSQTVCDLSAQALIIIHLILVIETERERQG